MSNTAIEETLALVGTLRDIAEEQGFEKVENSLESKGRFIEIVTEITERIAGMENLVGGEEEREKEKNAETAAFAALGKAAAEVGYRMNNLLALLATRMELAEICAKSGDLKKSLSNLGLAREYLTRVETMAVRLIDCTGHPSQPLRSDISEVVQATVSFTRLLSAYENIEFDVDLATDLPPLSIDVARWQQLVLSLLANAADAVGHRKGEGGRIRITTMYNTTEDRIIFTMEDMGRGIAPDDIALVFEPGFTTKGPRREGLGLTTSRRIVEEAGGEIFIESEQGKGTTVRIIMPVSH